LVQQRGAEVRVTVQDDGRGFDLAGLRRAGSENGRTSLSEQASVNDVIALAFLPGVTTSPEVTPIAGRGVGLDVVRQCLESLQGRVSVESTPGQGSSIQLIVPVSLTMTRGLLVRVGTENFVLPLLAVEKIVEPDQIFSLEGQTMITIDGKPLPLVPLAVLLRRNVTAEKNNRGVVVIMLVAEQRIALLVNDVITEQELAVKTLGGILQHVPNVAGAALLSNGDPIVVLNATDLLNAARGVRAIAIDNGYHNHSEQQTRNFQILVVDDSITTRTLEKNILEAAGYQVFTATDGLAALKQLKGNTIQLVVSDVQMPNMDGIALTRQLRGDLEYSKLPIILVTSLESHEDRERGLLAGANAYIVKRGFDQAELLSTITRLL
jgi:two-component system chemotaxis sensor kinase CheA